MNSVAMYILVLSFDVHVHAFLLGIYLEKGHRINIWSALLNITTYFLK